MRTLLLLALVALPLSVEANVYKWVDDSGVTHFGDVPREGAQVKRLRRTPSPCAGGADCRQNSRAVTERLNRAILDLRRDREDGEASAEPGPDQQAAGGNLSECERARSELAKLQFTRTRMTGPETYTVESYSYVENGQVQPEERKQERVRELQAKLGTRPCATR